MIVDLDPPARRAEALTRAIRGCFARLRALGDALHAERGVTAAMRAVMEALAERGAQTVPALARAKRVSRQNIQTLINALAQSGLAAARPNPADARSPLVALTPRGAAAFAAMRRRERGALAGMAAALAEHDLDAALAALAALAAHLDRELEKESRDA